MQVFDCIPIWVQWSTVCSGWLQQLQWNCSRKCNTVNTCNFCSQKVCSVALAFYETLDKEQFLFFTVVKSNYVIGIWKILPVSFPTRNCYFWWSRFKIHLSFQINLSKVLKSACEHPGPNCQETIKSKLINHFYICCTVL